MKVVCFHLGETSYHTFWDITAHTLKWMLLPHPPQFCFLAWVFLGIHQIFYMIIPPSVYLTAIIVPRLSWFLCMKFDYYVMFIQYAAMAKLLVGETGLQGTPQPPKMGSLIPCWHMFIYGVSTPHILAILFVTYLGDGLGVFCRKECQLLGWVLCPHFTAILNVGNSYFIRVFALLKKKKKEKNRK